MQMTAYSLVFFALLAIIPAGVVLLVAWVRIEATRGDNADAKHKVDLVVKDYNTILAEYATLSQKIVDAETACHCVRVKLVNVEESITALSNKWNSRERAERQAIKRAQREDEAEVMEAEPIIPGTEQLSMFQPKSQPVAPTLTPSKRKFGTMP